MVREIRILGLTISALLLPAACGSSGSAADQTPVAPKTEQLDPNACAQFGYANHDREGR